MKILLAIDGSPSSNAAVAEVARWPWPASSEVRIVTVDAPVEASLLKSRDRSVFDELMSQQREESNRRLTHAMALLAERAPGLKVTMSLLEGWPKDAIVLDAERWGADRVIVGSHGYGPIRRFFLGSVSMFVAHHAPCSVLIVRNPPEISPDSTRPAGIEGA